MTLLLPTILLSSVMTFTKILDITAEYIEQELFGKLISWLSYLFFPAIIAVLSSCHLAVSGVAAIPIYFRTLLWHPDGCSIFDMLCNPEGNCHLVQYDKDDNRPCWREHLQPVPQSAWRKANQNILSEQVFIPAAVDFHSCCFVSTKTLRNWLSNFNMCMQF
jgi:hypothetical protein